MCQTNCDVRDMFTRLHTYMKEGKFTDLYFIVGDDAIGAHKAVLALSSKVFQAMFESEMKESQTQEVVISDVDVEAFRAFLDYVYTKNEEDVGEHVDQLLMLGDKYDVQRLVISCESYIEKSLSLDNAVKYLQISDLHSRHELKKSVIDFIKNNITDLIRTAEWLELKTQNPKLVSAVVQSMIDDHEISDNIESFEKLNTSFCDAWIDIEGQRFPVDKFILTGKSDQFSKIFKDNPKEGQIDGISSTQFFQIMDYVYFNKLPTEGNENILKFAMEFKLEKLANHMISLYEQPLSLKNAITTLIMAHRLRLDSLKSPAMKLIVKHVGQLKNSTGWKDLFEYPDLMTEIFLNTVPSKKEASNSSDRHSSLDDLGFGLFD